MRRDERQQNARERRREEKRVANVCLPILQLPLVSFLFSSLSTGLGSTFRFHYLYGTGQDRMGQDTQQHDMKAYGTREQQGYPGNDQVFCFTCTFYSRSSFLVTFFLSHSRTEAASMQKEYQPTSHDNETQSSLPWARQIVDEKKNINILSSKSTSSSISSL